MKTIIVLTSLIFGSGLLLMDNSRQSGSTLPLSKSIFKRTGADNGPVGTISIIIDKSDYELSVYDEKGWYATYPVVFGNNSLDDKKIAGDKNTPEGTFH